MSRTASTRTSREDFLDAIASRLGRPRLTTAPARPVLDIELPGATLPPESLAERFRSELELLGGHYAEASSLAELTTVLRGELTRLEANRIVTWARKEFAGLALDWLWDERQAVAWNEELCNRAQHNLSRVQESARVFRNTALAAEMGITRVDFAVAATGTLVVSAAESRPRQVSLVPSAHLAIVRASELVPTLGVALERYRARAHEATTGSGAISDMSSAIHFISGPSRTSDIENDHTIGVHGPAMVSVILWRDVSIESAAS